MNPSMSVRCDPNQKQLIILGQDESCFKQNSFSKRCWVGPGGEMKLLPKTDGYTTIMVSAFVSREFGFGLELTDDELQKVNKRRRSREWGTYLSKKEDIAVNGSDKKRLLKDSLTLVRFFDVGINEEGYWNYNQLAHQVEDIYDVLSVKFDKNNVDNNKNVDFAIMLDQSSGHGKMRDGALNENLMSVKFGGR